ncbi:hypothetical protein FF1_018124 [Malus domestica]
MEEMRLSVTNAHLELMNRTPFGRLFKAYHENLIIDGVCRKCDANIVSILKFYDPVQKAFVFGGIIATITVKDIAEIFGLPDEGEEINLNSRNCKSAFRGFYERCLADIKDISKKILEERILRVVKLHGSVHEGDFVRLVCLYFCLTLFFSTSGNNTSLYMVGYVEDITKMKDYVWAVAVNNWLLGTIDNMGERYESVTGCVIGLLFWFCERTHLINPIRGRENMPLRVVKWNLSELYAKMEIMKIHELEEVVQVGGGNLCSHGRGINVEPHKVLDEEFLPIFDILPSEFMENNLGEPSNSKADLNDLERKLQEMSLLVEDYRSEIMKLTIENKNLKEELKCKENYIVKDKSPKQNSMILRVKLKQRKPLLMPDYKYDACVNKKMVVHMDKNYVGSRAIQMHEYGNIKIMAPMKTIAVRRLRVGKCLPILYAEKLKQFLDLNDDRVSMWKGEHCAVIRDDILALLNEGGVVDYFFEILNDNQIGIPKDQLKYGFMPTFAWVRENDYVFFPINHFKGMHYTLLVFNKQSGWWEHYNTLQTKLNMFVDPYFEEAKKLHVKISDYFKHMKDSISRKLNKNSICKHIM